MSKSLALSKGSRRWTAVEGRSALTALQSSGLSVSEFSRREGLDPHRLRAWARRLDAPGPPIVAPTSIEVARRAIEPVEVVLPSGIVLRVAETVDPKALRRIADALEDRDRC